ncbi:ComF family protein [Brackiella oedipodis]|uniref:ComF family protein n=1 Tax=Brackiella oedipodis TaxID=124225 RepID=UPI0006862D7B|nr:phosphoribosyltransferase family protein [Brackiella oedipodis]
MFGFLQQMPLSRCPLCMAAAAPRQFCAGCQKDILQARHAPLTACPQCHLPLPSRLGLHATCPQCHHLKPVIQRIDFLFYHHAPLDSLVLRFKNAREIYLAECFAQLFKQSLTPYWPSAERPSLIPIPANPKALQRRGYNPPTELARALSKVFHLPLAPFVLYKNPSVTEQKNLSALHRQQHMTDRFYCLQALQQPHLILVDDVMTSGATLNAAARALFAAGAQRVDAIVISRALSHDPDHPIAS